MEAGRRYAARQCVDGRLLVEDATFAILQRDMFQEEIDAAGHKLFAAVEPDERRP